MLWLYRAMARRRPADSLRYALRSREVSNFTYELSNEDAISEFVGGVLAVDPGAIAAYLAELRADDVLVADLRERMSGSKRRNPEPLLGKRRALYCIVRAGRPRVVVESGVHDGLGAAVLLRALERNADQGSPGRLLAFDINPDAGWLIDRGRHQDRFSLIIGDTKARLEGEIAGSGVDFFIHDSLKTHEHETFELEAAVRHGGDGRLTLYTDDAGSTGALAEVCARNRGRSRTLQEIPERHFWRGNELGICVIDPS